MRKITISTLLTLLYLAGTAQALRAQQTTEDASLPADSVGQERALTINEMRQQVRRPVFRHRKSEHIPI